MYTCLISVDKDKIGYIGSIEIEYTLQLGKAVTSQSAQPVDNVLAPEKK
jgi:hypothetical protein